MVILPVQNVQVQHRPIGPVFLLVQKEMVLRWYHWWLQHIHQRRERLVEPTDKEPDDQHEKGENHRA